MIEVVNARDQFAFDALHSFFVEVQTNLKLATYMLNMRNSNQEIRIAGSSCSGGGRETSSLTVPRPLSRFDTYPRWPPVTQSIRSRRSYGKIEDFEQSSLFSSSLPLPPCTSGQKITPRAFFFIRALDANLREK